MPDSVAVARPTSYVEWPAVFAGAAVASALSFVLLTAGAAIGLSLLSPIPSQSYGRLAGSLAAFWLVVVPIGSFLVGGYIAGRMRTAWDPAKSDEVEFRDGIHGLLVWSLSIGFGAFLTFISAATAAQTGADVGRAGLSDRTTIIAPAVNGLLRPAALAAANSPASAQTRTETSPAASPSRSSPSALPGAPLSEEVRFEVSRTISTAIASGGLSANDRAYLAQLVASRSGLPPQEAEQRVDLAYAEAVDQVDRARKATALAGLATVTALLIGLAAAWYAAQQGGRHRDQNIPARFGFPRPVLRRTSVATPVDAERVKPSGNPR